MTTEPFSDVDWETLRHQLLPGGIGRSSLHVGARSPLAVRAASWWIEDAAGQRLIDTNNNMTVNLHGNGHPWILDVVHQRLAEGLVSMGIANTDELALAETLVRRSEWAQQVRFTNSGVEAVMLAIRMARAATGRDRILILKPGYHGTADPVMSALGGPGERGVPRGVLDATITIGRGDTGALVDAFESSGEQIAAVVLDLCANRGGLTLLDGDFTGSAAQLTQRSGAWLIIDEVVTYRNAFGGMAAEYGLRPDLLVLGKTIGGGFPIGAVVGNRSTMASLDPDGFALEHGGTFTANPITMAAGTTALQMYDEHEVERLNRLGMQLEASVTDKLEGTGWRFRRSGSVFRMWPEAWAPLERSAAQKALFWAAYEVGVLGSGSGLSALSTVMDEDVVNRIGVGLQTAARAVRPNRQ